MSRKTATLSDAMQHLNLVPDNDNSLITRLARKVLVDDIIIKAMTTQMEELIKRCDECERGHRKLATQVSSEIKLLTGRILTLEKRNTRVKKALK